MYKDKVFIYSVQHTGTRFLSTTLKDNGIEHDAIHVQFLMDKEPKQPGIIICPIRDPETCAKSWIARKKLRLVEDGFFQKSWETLNRLYEHNDIHFLPIDADQETRKRHLDGISVALGKKLTSPWNPVNVGPSKEGIEVPVDLSAIYELPVVKRFGYNPSRAPEEHI